MESQGVPIEIFLKILQLLPHQQLLISKRVNRTWYAVISSEFRFEHAVLASCRPLAMRWHATYDFASPDCLIQIHNNELQLIDLRQFHFTTLRRLCLYWTKKDNFDRTNFSVSELVNHLNQLEALELIGVQSGVSEEHLALPNLKILNIDEFWFTHLTISCPRLVNLRLLLSYFYRRSRHRIEFEHPETVRCLELGGYRHEWIERFVQLEELHVQYISTIPDTFLRELPMLKEIHFYEEANIYKSLIEQKIIYNRPTLRIFFCGLAFDTDALPEDALLLDYRCPSASAVRFIKEHYSKFVARPQTHIYGLPYHLFEDAFPDGIPEELIQRLVSLRGFVIDRPVQNVDQLVRLLEITGPGLDLIRIQNTELDEEFFEMLPRMCPAVAELTIAEESEFNPEILFDFRGLRVIKVDLQLTGKFAKMLFQKNEYLELLDFCYKTYKVKLYRLPEGKLNLVFDRKDLHERCLKGASEMMAELGLKDYAQLETLLEVGSANIVN